MSTWESEMTPEEWATVNLPKLLCLFCGEELEQWDLGVDEDSWVCPKGCGIPYG